MTDIALPGLPLAVEPHRRPAGPRTAVAFSDGFIDSACQRVQAGKPLRRSFKPWGRVHIDRPLPFLVVYRQPIDRDDFGTELLIVGEASYLLAPGDRRLQNRIAALVQGIAEVQSKNFGAFLILEVWSAQDTAERPLVDGQSEPGFRIARSAGEKLASTVTVLADSLEEVRIKGELASVEIASTKSVHPPGLKPLLSGDALEAAGAHLLGLEVRPIYRKTDMSESYPLVHRTLHKGLSKALKRTVFEYTRRRTSHRPANYQALGRRAMVKAVWEVDRRLAKVSNSFDLILQVTPTNTDAAWSDFRKHRFERPPEFTSRPLKLDTAIVKRELYKIPIERVEDPLLGQLFRDQQLSLDRRLTLLGDRGSPQFLLGSLQVFGGVDEPLLTLAHDILDRIPSRSRDESKRGAINATEFAARADEEIEYYRSIHADVRGGVDVRDDIAGAMVSRGRLLVGSQMRVPISRVDALIAHEVGTHIVTYVNGQAQPFRQLSFGLPGYDELQEGMAVLAEYLVGGFSRPRLRLLAARVLAIHRMVQGAEFTDVFRELDRAHDFAQRTAFTITMRVFRGGGLTKDVVYLRGLVGVLSYLREGGSLEPLLVGKLGPEHVSIIEELQWRKVLVPPPLRPRYLDKPAAQERLDGLRRGASVLDLAMEGRQ